MIPVRCIFVLFCWYECIVSVPRLSPECQAPTAIGLILVRYIPMAIRKSVCHVPTTIGLALVRRGVVTHIFWIASSLILVDIWLPRHWVSWPSRGLICVRWYGGGLNASCMSELAMAAIPDLAFNKAFFKVGSDPLATCWNVSSIFPWKLRLGIGSDPPIACCCISAIFLRTSDFWFPSIIVFDDCWDDSVGPSF